MSGQGERGFEDLQCYQLTLQVLEEAYRVAQKLSLEERFNLSDQLRRAAVSVCLNIAEGYGRYHYLDCLRFYYQARGSLNECLSAFISCQVVGYQSQSDLDRQRQLVHNALRALNGYIRYVRKQRQGAVEYGTRALKKEDSTFYDPSVENEGD